jgi:hypothetical protein
MTCRNFKYTTDIFKQLFPKFSRRLQVNDPKMKKRESPAMRRRKFDFLRIK